MSLAACCLDGGLVSSSLFGLVGTGGAGCVWVRLWVMVLFVTTADNRGCSVGYQLCI